MTVPLPDAGDGSRRRRRSDRRSGARRLALRVVGIVLLVAVIGGIGWVIVGLATGDDDSPANGAASTTGGKTAPPSLVVLTDAAGDVYGLTILAPAKATIVHVPPGTLVEVPSLGLASLRDAARDGGIALLQHSLENVLGVSFTSVAVLNPTDLAAAVTAVGPLEVTVDSAVQAREPTGRVSVVVPAGTQTVAPDAALNLLSAVGDGTSLDRLVRHQAFWSAYLGALGNDTPTGALTAVAPALKTLARDDVQHTILPVEAVSGVEGDQELYRVVDASLARLVQRLFGVSTHRITVQVLNGVGAPGVAQLVQPLLVNASARMTLSGNADRFDYATTQIVYYDDAHRADAAAVRKALGVGELVKSLTGLDVVDVTVVVGTDFTSAHPSGG